MLKPTREYLKLLTETLSNKTGVTIREGKNWSSNLKTKEVIYKMEDLKDLDYPIVRGLLLHETAHINYTEADKNEANRPIVKKYGQVIHEIYNAYEDIRIENKLRDRYGDYAESSLNQTNVHAIKCQLEKTKGDLTPAPKLHQFLLMTLFSHDSYINPLSEQLLGYGASKIIFNREKLKIDEAVIKKLIDNRNMLSDFYYSVKLATTTLELMDMVDRELIPIIKDFITQAPPDQKIPNLSNREQMGGGDTGKQSQGSGEEEVLTEQEAKAILTPYISTLAHRLHDILEEQRATRYRGAKKSGKLLSPNAYKVLTGDTRIFSRKTTPDAPNYEIFLGLDSSGSMNKTNRVYYAKLSAVLLKEVSKKLNFKITTYSYGDFTNRMETLDEYKNTGGGTNDLSLIAEINKKLNPDKKSLIFIITDGYANRTDSTKQQAEYQEQEAEATKKGATIYGIGMGKLNNIIFRKNYRNAVIVPNIEDLPAEMISIVRQVIHR